jgi:hypothetical protein
LEVREKMDPFEIIAMVLAAAAKILSQLNKKGK